VHFVGLCYKIILQCTVQKNTLVLRVCGTDIEDCTPKDLGSSNIVQQVARSDKNRVFSKAVGATPHASRIGSE